MQRLMKRITHEIMAKQCDLTVVEHGAIVGGLCSGVNISKTTAQLNCC